MKKKLLLFVMSASLLLSATGCFGTTQEDPDTFLTLTVEDSMLTEDVQEEEYEAKTKGQLYKVTGLETIGSQVYLDIEPGADLIKDGAKESSVYINDVNLIQALVDLQDEIYINIAPTPMTDNDKVFVNVNTYLADMNNDELIAVARAAQKRQETIRARLGIALEEAEKEEQPSEQQIEEGDDDAPALQGLIEELGMDEQEENPDGNIDDAAPSEEPSDEEPAENPNPMDWMEAYENGEIGDNGTFLSQEERQGYMKMFRESFNFSLAKDVIVYDKDCNRLGEYTSAQLKSYKYALAGEPAPYDLVGGYVTASDLLEDTTYTTKAIDAKNGTFDIKFKNDTGKPLVLYMVTKDEEQIIPMFNRTFSVTGYYPKGEWSQSGTLTDYNFRIITFNTDNDLYEYIATLSNDTLKLSTVQPNEKGKYIIAAEGYIAIYNDKSNPVQLTSDTKNVEILQPGEVIGILPDMQKEFKMVEQLEEK